MTPVACRAPGAGLAAALLIAGLLAACGGDRGAEPAPIRIHAASSLRAVLGELTAAYAAARPGRTFEITAGSSTALATRIAEGAPAELLLAADEPPARIVADAGLAAGPLVAVAANALVVAVPTAGGAGIASPADLARPGIRVVAAAAGVPVQVYADRLVERLALLDGYGPAYPAAVAANVVSREESAAGILVKVALGEGDAGFVYATDARTADGIRAIPVPAEASVRATYVGVVVAGPRAGEAAAFLAWLAGPEGAAILAAAGFLPAP